MSQYDTTIKVGDLITAYHKGIWRVITIETRKNNSPLFHYRQVLTQSYKPGKNMVRCCDASYCMKVDDAYIQKLQDDINQKIAVLKSLRDTMAATLESAK